jgi:hypothetical protein
MDDAIPTRCRSRPTSRSLRRPVRHVVYDTNYWKSFLCARLLVPIGNRSCLSLFGDRPEMHCLPDLSWPHQTVGIRRQRHSLLRHSFCIKAFLPLQPPVAPYFALLLRSQCQCREHFMRFLADVLCGYCDTCRNKKIASRTDNRRECPSEESPAKPGAHRAIRGGSGGTRQRGAIVGNPVGPAANADCRPG